MLGHREPQRKREPQRDYLISGRKTEGVFHSVAFLFSVALCGQFSLAP